MSDNSQADDLAREIEETRERLATTIDQLLHRSSPKTIASRQVAEIKAYYVDASTGEPRTDNILMTVGGVVGAIVLLVVVRKITS